MIERVTDWWDKARTVKSTTEIFHSFSISEFSLNA